MTCWRIAHRGAEAPENTMRSFRRALALGADAVECDVHLSQDGEAVIIHDDTLERTTGRHGRIADLPLAELKKLDAGDGERIPTLEELLELVTLPLPPQAEPAASLSRARERVRERALRAQNYMVFIEIKAEAAVPRVAELVTRFGQRYGYARFPVIGFDWDTLVAVKKRDAHIEIGASPPPDHLPPDFMARANDAGMWSVNPCIDILTPAMVEEAHRRGLRIITWTANTPQQIARATSLGADGIISDNPRIYCGAR